MAAWERLIPMQQFYQLSYGGQLSSSNRRVMYIYTCIRWCVNVRCFTILILNLIFNPVLSNNLFISIPPPPPRAIWSPYLYTSSAEKCLETDKNYVLFSFRETPSYYKDGVRTNHLSKLVGLDNQIISVSLNLGISEFGNNEDVLINNSMFTLRQKRLTDYINLSILVRRRCSYCYLIYTILTAL
jgi:hypothetical protein